MLVLAVGTAWRPAFGVAGILCLFGLEQWLQSRGGMLLARPYIVNVGMALIIVLGVAVHAMRGELCLGLYPKVGKLILVLFAFAGVSFFWTTDRGAFVERWGIALPYLLTFIILTPLIIRQWQDTLMAFNAMLLLGTGILLLLSFSTEWTSRGVMFDYETKGNPLAIASFAGYVTLGALLLNFRGVGRFWQFARWGVLLLGVYVSMQSGSRGQTGALILAALVLLPMSRRFGSAAGFAGTLFAVILVGGVIVWAQGMWATGARWDWSEMRVTYAESRLAPAAMLLKEWLQAGPIAWVIGLGNSASFHPESVGFYPHLVAAEVLAEEGLIGAGLFIGIIVLAVRSVLFGNRYMGHDPEARGVFATMGALLLFELILSCKQGSLLGSPNLFMFVIILGRMEMAARQSLGSHGEWKETDFTSTPPQHGRSPYAI